jgi:tetratricopeptide (TPR) repeat protein
MQRRSLSALSLFCIGQFFLTGTMLVAQAYVAPEPAQPRDISTDSVAPANSADASGDASDFDLPMRPSALENGAATQASLDTLNSLLQHDRQSGYRQAEANILAAMSVSHAALHQPERAIKDLQDALVIWRELGNIQGQALTTAHIGDLYRRWGFPETANRFYRDALNLYPRKDSGERATTLNNLGLGYFALRDKKKCFDNLNEALASYRALGDRRGEARTLVNLGAGYNFLANDPEKALGVFQEAITELQLLDDRSAEANALDNLGVVWIKLHKPEMASLSFQRAIALYQKSGDTKGEAAVRKHMKVLGEPGNVAMAR